MKKNSVWLVAASIAMVLAIVPGLAEAGSTCTDDSCKNVTVRQVSSNNGKILFAIDDPGNLASLGGSGSICFLKNGWLGAPTPVIYLDDDDPEKEEKYTMLLTAIVAGGTIGFEVQGDGSASNYCEVKFMYYGPAL